MCGKEEVFDLGVHGLTAVHDVIRWDVLPSEVEKLSGNLCLKKIVLSSCNENIPNFWKFLFSRISFSAARFKFLGSESGYWMRSGVPEKGINQG